MHLELADGNFTNLNDELNDGNFTNLNDELSRGGRHRRNFARKFGKALNYVPGYKIAKGAYEGGRDLVTGKTHFYLPSKNMFIREDMADGMPFNEFTQTLMSEGYTTEQISELSGRRSERKARKQQRRDFRQEKRNLKLDKKRSKNELRRAKAYAKKSRADQGLPDENAELFKGVVDTATSFIPGFKKRSQGGGGGEDESPEPNTGGGEDTSERAKTPDGGTGSEDKILGMPKKVVYIGGAILGVIILGTIATKVIKNKRNKH